LRATRELLKALVDPAKREAPLEMVERRSDMAVVKKRLTKPLLGLDVIHVQMP
jgi:hypothetical protein